MLISQRAIFRFVTGFQRFDHRIEDFKHLKEAKPALLSEEVISKVLKAQQLSSTWSLEPAEGSARPTWIRRHLKFKDFKEAMSFMNQVAIVAEQIDHHPEWENVFNQVKVKLETHDAKGITIKDLFLAHAIDKIAMDVMVKSAESPLDTRILQLSSIAQIWNHNFDVYQRMVTARQVE